MNDIQKIAEHYAKESGFELQEDEQQNTEQNEGNVQQESPQNEQEEVLEANQEQQEQTTETQVSEDFSQKIQEYEQKIKEYEAKMQDYQAPKEPEFASERIKKLNELAKAGVDIDSEDFWKWQALDVNAMNPDQKESAIHLIKLELKAKNPDMTDDRIERKIKRKYEALFDEEFTEDDREYRVALEDLMDDAFDAKKTVLEYKNKVTLPKVDLEAKRQQEEQSRKAIEQFNISVKQSVSSYSEEPFKITPELELKYSPSEESRKFIESSLVNSASLLEDLWVDKEKGVVNLDKARRDLLLISEFDKIAKVIYDQGMSAGREEIASGIENSERSSPSIGGGEEKEDTYQQAIRKVLSGGFF